MLQALGKQWSRCHFLCAFSSGAAVRKVNTHTHRVTDTVFCKDKIRKCIQFTQHSISRSFLEKQSHPSEARAP